MLGTAILHIVREIVEITLKRCILFMMIGVDVK
jgi:hypothetical protein